MSTKAVYRPTISSDEVFALLDTLDRIKIEAGLNPILIPFHKKLDSLAYDIGKGNRNPAYVATGVSRKPALTLESLGATTEERQKVVTEDDLDELERLNAEMLAGLAAEGNSNVVLEERRKVPRTEVEPSNDDALFKSL